MVAISVAKISGQRIRKYEYSGMLLLPYRLMLQ